MKIHHHLVFSLLAGFALHAHAQDNGPLALANANVNAPTGATPQKIVVVTGTRFSYKLVQKWIDDYNKVKPNIQVIIESRGSNDPKAFDILAEVYEQDPTVRSNREYLYVGRYAILPVAKSSSAFAKTYTEKGLNTDVIKQIFFHDMFVSEEDRPKPIKMPFTVYTRLQKAGAPIVFTKYFGFQQKDLQGNQIAGSDEHLMKALLRDSTGVSYLPTPLIYDNTTRKPVEGLVVLPVDVNGNGRVNDTEKFYDTVDQMIERLEATAPGDIKNIPIDYLHLSVDKQHASSEALDFLKWVSENGQRDLHDFGYLKPEPKRVDNDKF